MAAQGWRSPTPVEPRSAELYAAVGSLVIRSGPPDGPRDARRECTKTARIRCVAAGPRGTTFGKITNQITNRPQLSCSCRLCTQGRVWIQLAAFYGSWTSLTVGSGGRI